VITPWVSAGLGRQAAYPAGLVFMVRYGVMRATSRWRSIST